MMSNARCWKRRLAALAIATSLLSGCATVGSDRVVEGTCPLVVEYSQEFQALAAEELARLPCGRRRDEARRQYRHLLDRPPQRSGGSESADALLLPIRHSVVVSHYKGLCKALHREAAVATALLEIDCAKSLGDNFGCTDDWLQCNRTGGCAGGRSCALHGCDPAVSSGVRLRDRSRAGG